MSTLLLLLLGLLASTSCLYVGSRTPKLTLDAAFLSWREQQLQAEARVAREINRLAHPDVPVRLVFEGTTRRAIIPGSATIDQLHHEAARLHNLDCERPLNFFLKGQQLHLGMPMSESPLANTRELDVVVKMVHQSENSPGAEWWSGASKASGHRRRTGATSAEAQRAAAAKRLSAARSASTSTHSVSIEPTLPRESSLSSASLSSATHDASDSPPKSSRFKSSPIPLHKQRRSDRGLD